MLERWPELGDVLHRGLEHVAAHGSPYLEALLAAIREEMAAAQGGPAPAHGRLRELGTPAGASSCATAPAVSLKG